MQIWVEERRYHPHFVAQGEVNRVPAWIGQANIHKNQQNVLDLYLQNTIIIKRCWDRPWIYLAFVDLKINGV